MDLPPHVQPSLDSHDSLKYKHWFSLLSQREVPYRPRFHLQNFPKSHQNKLQVLNSSKYIKNVQESSRNHLVRNSQIIQNIWQKIFIKTEHDPSIHEHC